jgi:hypothetical protein
MMSVSRFSAPTVIAVIVVPMDGDCCVDVSLLACAGYDVGYHSPGR